MATFLLQLFPAAEKSETWKRFQEKIEEPGKQRRIVLVIVCIALLLDNMLYMVIVPIIPDYLRDIGVWQTHMVGQTVEFHNISNRLIPMRIGGRVVYEGEESAVGMLFASKAIVQLFINPFSGHIIDRIGYDIPMMIGLSIMFLSTAVFAVSKSYSLLFFARSLQGVGSAFADTSGLAMIADRFNDDEKQRQKALGIALAFISFGCLVAPPFGGLLYEFCGKELPFIILSLVCLTDGILLLLVMQPVKKKQKESGIERPTGTPIHVLLKDPYVACCAGALVMANVSLAFLEPTIAIWMQDNMEVEEWQIGMIWLPAFFPHVAGVWTTVRIADRYPKLQWAIAGIGLAIEGICSFMVPFSTSFWGLFLPISGICFGIALVDTAILPLLAHIVDTRYVSVYGSIYAIADISYSLAYAFGPIIAGGIVESIGFLALNIVIAISNLAYVPVLSILKDTYEMRTYNQFSAEEAAAAASATHLPPSTQQQQQTVVTASGGVTVQTTQGPGDIYGNSSWGDYPGQTTVPGGNPFVGTTTIPSPGPYAAHATPSQFEMKGNPGNSYYR